MRTKNELLLDLYEDVNAAKQIGTLQHLTDLPLLEVMTDIRDLLYASLTPEQQAFFTRFQIHK